MNEFGLEVCACNAQVVICAELEVFVQFSNSMVSQAGWPGVMICSDSCVEVTKDVELFTAGNVFHDHLVFVIKPFLYFLRGAKCWGVHTHKVDRSYGCIG